MAPPEVLAELSEARRPGPVQAFASQPPVWIEVRCPRVMETIPRLHPGEQAAISLSSELGAVLLLMDEKDGRRVAVERQIPITGTVGVLERAAAQGLIDLRQAFTRLKTTDFWIRPDFLDDRLRAFEERLSQISRAHRSH